MKCERCHEEWFGQFYIVDGKKLCPVCAAEVKKELFEGVTDKESTVKQITEEGETIKFLSYVMQHEELLPVWASQRGMFTASSSNFLSYIKRKGKLTRKQKKVLLNLLNYFITNKIFVPSVDMRFLVKSLRKEVGDD